MEDITEPWSLKSGWSRRGKMDYKAIQQLIETVSHSQLQECEIEWEGIRIMMKKKGNNESTITTAIEPVLLERQEEKEKERTPEGKIIRSPMVGTFYAAPDPSSPPFVTTGDHVKKGDVLCIIEAMKLMKEIDSEIEGEIIEVFVKNEEVVEYGQPLFRICP